MKYIYIVLIIFMMMSTANSLKEPYEYGNNECELIMKDYQAVYGGNFVFIMPHDESGSRDFSVLGHWVNRAYSEERGIYYIDYESQTYFNDIEEISEWYKMRTGRRNRVYDYSHWAPPFSIRWYYPPRSPAPDENDPVRIIHNS